jgi:radical SAM-linked protein
MPLDKVRTRFRKSGDLRLVSHLDLMRSLERLLRRAMLPFRMTEGFHPTPRLVLAQSLPLGVVGHNEVMELELTEEVGPDEVLRRLRGQAPPGIEFLSARRIPVKVTARPRRAVYRVPLGNSCDGEPARRQAHPPADAGGWALARRIAAFLASTESWAERERPKPRAVNIRPYVDALAVEGGALVISCWLTQAGSARADEIAAAVGITDPPLIERVDLELMDEVSPDEAARTPKIEPHTRPLDRVWTGPRPEVPRETWGATANGPIVE